MNGSFRAFKWNQTQTVALLLKQKENLEIKPIKGLQGTEKDQQLQTKKQIKNNPCEEGSMLLQAKTVWITGIECILKAAQWDNSKVESTSLFK